MKPFRSHPTGLLLAGLLVAGAWGFASLAAQAAAPATPAAGRLPALFENSPADDRPRQPLPERAKAVRRVKTQASVLEGLAPDRTHRLALPVDAARNYTAALKRHTRYRARTHAWSGEVEELPGSTLTLVVHNGVMAMELIAPGHLPLVLQYDGTDDPLVCEQGSPEGDYCGRPANPATPVRRPEPPPRREKPASDRSAKAALSSVAPAAGGFEYDAARVDVAIVYSHLARQAAGGQNQIEARIFAYMSAMNNAHWDSRTETNFRLVHLAEVEYFEEGTMDDHLTRLEETDETKNPYAPMFRYVHEARLREGADLVSLFVDGSNDTSGTLGIAGRDAAFSCLKWNSSSIVVTHELGHNLGLCHETANTPVCDGSYAYSHAWRAQWNYLPTYEEHVSTLMWSSIGPAVKNILRFSNPNQNYTLYPVSPYSPVSVPLGNASSADNARTLREKGYESALYLNPRLHVSATGSADAPATRYDPQSSVFNAANYWYRETLGGYAWWLSDGPPVLRVEPGTYREPDMRLDQRLRIERWGDSGTARITRYTAAPASTTSAASR